MSLLAMSITEMSVLEILSWIFLTAGGLVGVVGALGLLRFPDFYSRQHAAGTTDTLCAMLILLGLGIQAGLSLAAFKLAAILLFLIVTSPVATHALANTALHSGLKPFTSDDNSEDKS